MVMVGARYARQRQNRPDAWGPYRHVNPGPPAAAEDNAEGAATLATLAAQSAGGGFSFTLFIFKKCQNVQPLEDLVLDG